MHLHYVNTISKSCPVQEAEQSCNWGPAHPVSSQPLPAVLSSKGPVICVNENHLSLAFHGRSSTEHCVGI